MELTTETLNQAKDDIGQLIAEISKVIIGKKKVIQLTIAAFLAEGHVLFEDIPGTGKTMLVKTLAKATACHYNRIQFTPDLLPSDIVGISLYNTHTQLFEFKPGPIFADILLADEINRTTPRTQAALLEAMSEKQVTIDGTTYPLNPHFFVLATQNPTEYEGTYPLPEAQLDRFLMKLNVGYPKFQEEMALLLGENRNVALSKTQAVIDAGTIAALKVLVSQIHIDPSLVEYALNLVQSTRKHSKIKLGVSPRASIGYIQAAKAYALTEGRAHVMPNDFLTLLQPVFSHRILLHSRYRKDEGALKDVLNDIATSVVVPVRS